MLADLAQLVKDLQGQLARGGDDQRPKTVIRSPPKTKESLQDLRSSVPESHHRPFHKECGLIPCTELLLSRRQSVLLSYDLVLLNLHSQP